MEYKEIKKLMDDMANSKLSEFEIEYPDGIKIKMLKENVKYVEVKNKNIDNIDTKYSVETNVKKQQEVKTKVIKSPMVGMFYSKPSEKQKPFVEIGSNIKKGATVCIIEAMKLMNELASDYDGKIVEILVKDGETVEYGQSLFIVE